MERQIAAGRWHAPAAEINLTPDAAATVTAIQRDGTNPSTDRARRHDLRFLDRWHRVKFGTPLPIPTPISTVIEAVTWRLAPDPFSDAHLVATGIKARPGPTALSTISRRLAALSVAHKGWPSNPVRDPRVRDLLAMSRRALAAQGVGPRRMRATTIDVLGPMLATCSDDLRGVRDQAILLVGFASGGRRRSELAGMRVEDLQRVDGLGYTITIRRSKTDQDGVGKTVPIKSRAADAVEAWLAESGIVEGHLFRGISPAGRLNDGIGGQTIARMIQRRAALAGLDPADFGGHSLRSGFVTEAGRRGVSLQDTMALSGHRSVTVALGYHQAGNVLRNPAADLANCF